MRLIDHQTVSYFVLIESLDLGNSLVKPVSFFAWHIAPKRINDKTQRAHSRLQMQ